MKKLYMIGGRAGSGKDTLGDIMENKGYNRFAFADYLKQSTATKYNISLRDLNTQQGKKKIYCGKTYRQILISEATNYRSNDKYFFARHVIDNLKQQKSFDKVIITDFRFPEEIEYARNELEGIYDIKTILIKRDAHISIDDDSEKALDTGFNFDHVLHNNQSIEDLENQLYFI